MVAMAVYPVTMVLWKETALPLCRAMERHWRRNVVSPVSSVIVVIRLFITTTINSMDDVTFAHSGDRSRLCDSGV